MGRIGEGKGMVAVVTCDDGSVKGKGGPMVCCSGALKRSEKGVVCGSDDGLLLNMVEDGGIGGGFLGREGRDEDGVVMSFNGSAGVWVEGVRVDGTGKMFNGVGT